MPIGRATGVGVALLVGGGLYAFPTGMEALDEHGDMQAAKATAAQAAAKGDGTAEATWNTVASVEQADVNENVRMAIISSLVAVTGLTVIWVDHRRK